MTARTLYVPMLLALLVAVLLGPGVVTAAEPRATTGRIMIPAAAFNPTGPTIEYSNGGYYLTGTGTYQAMVEFPAPVVNIRRITLYATGSSSGVVCAFLYRAYPPDADSVEQGSVCTTDDPAFPQVVSTSSISPRRVNTATHRSFLRISMVPGEWFTGVSVFYSY
jgi:hypothetical protein